MGTLVQWHRLEQLHGKIWRSCGAVEVLHPRARTRPFMKLLHAGEPSYLAETARRKPSWTKAKARMKVSKARGYQSSVWKTWNPTPMCCCQAKVAGSSRWTQWRMSCQAGAKVG